MRDIGRVLEWSSSDGRFVERVTANMDPDRRLVLEAIIETRGDHGAFAARVAPDVLARVRARIPKPLAVLAEPLAMAWTVPTDLSADKIAEQFFARYGVRLEELTGHASKVAAAAKTASAAIGGARTAGELTDAVSGLESALGELSSVVTECSHPEGSSWATEIGNVAREGGGDLVEAARNLHTLVTTMRSNIEAIERAMSSWAEALIQERAATAESKARHVRAAVEVVAEMKEQIAALTR